jgi:hypothetical protein
LSSRGARPGAESAAAYLRQLLAEPGRYRDRWEQRARRIQPGKIDSGAVARVLAAHSASENRAGEHGSALQLRRAVAKGISGQLLSPRLLRQLTQAFDLSEQDANRLWRLYSQDDERPWRTLALQEYHQLGPDGIPVKHQTRHVLVAVRDGVDRYPYRFDTDQLSVSMVRGGTVSEPYPTGEGLFAVDILFSPPLKRGEPIGFEYDVDFHYRTPPPPEFRRGVRNRLESLSISVRFHPARLPRAIWWATWSGYQPGSQVVDRSRVQLDEECCAFTQVRDIEAATVGYHWEW